MDGLSWHTRRWWQASQAGEQGAHFIWRRVSLSPLWKGMWKNSHILGSSAHARIRRSVKYLRKHLASLLRIAWRDAPESCTCWSCDRLWQRRKTLA